MKASLFTYGIVGNMIVGFNNLDKVDSPSDLEQSDGLFWYSVHGAIL